MCSYSQPNILRCIAVLTAVRGLHGFRLTFTFRRRTARVLNVSNHACSHDRNNGTCVTAATLSTATTVEKDERPWLGVGPDPMAESRINLPSALEAAKKTATLEGEGGNGDDIRVKEVWLNGPFMAPLPSQPVVSTLTAVQAAVAPVVQLTTSKPSDTLGREFKSR